MPISEVRVATPEASRYLQQLCKHWSHKFTVEFTAERGRVPFDSERTCQFDAANGTLTMRVEAADDAALVRTQSTVESHLKRFAFRENFGELEWKRVD